RVTTYGVVAIGRWQGSAVPTEVSTVDYTADGSFAITLADGISGSLEVVARPYDTNVVAPTLYLGGLPANTTQCTLSQPGYLGNTITVTIPVEGVAGNG